MSDGSRTLPLAEHYLDMNRPAEALHALDRGGDGSIEREEFWSLRSRALLQLDRHGEAVKAAREGLSRHPDSMLLLVRLCDAEAAQGHVSEAERAILQAIHLEPEHPDLIARYALLVAQGGQFDKADKLLEEAARLDPDSRYVAWAGARVSYLRGDDRRALVQGREVLARDADDPYAHALLGASLAARGRTTGASRHFRTAAELDPGDVDITDAARSIAADTHWLMAPLRPLQRFGPVAVWIAAVVTMLVLQSLGFSTLLAIVVPAWLLFCVYSWIVPPMLRWWIRRRSG